MPLLSLSSAPSPFTPASSFRRPQRRHRLLITAALLAASFGSAHATNGYFAHGYGAQSLGIAGVAIALPQDALAIASNPAGIAQLGSRFDAGLTLFRPERSATIRGNGVPGFNGEYSGDGKKNFWIPELGYTRAIDPKLSVGLAIYGNGGMNTRYERNPFGAIGGQGRAGVNLEQIFVSPALAYKLDDQHTLGVALNLVHQRFSAEGLQPFAQAGTSSAPQHVTNQGTSSSSGAGIRLGWLGQLTPDWQVGASWSSKVNGSFDRYRGLFAESGGFDIPANWGLGVAWQASPDVKIAADYQRILYSQVKSVANPLSRLLAGQALGTSDGPGFGWRDINVVKLGVSWRQSQQLTLRAGYSHADQPIPSDQTLFNILAPGVVQDHLTAGFTWRIDAHGEVTGYYAHALNKEVKGQGSIPSTFGGGEADIRMKQNIFGVAYGWKF